MARPKSMRHRHPVDRINKRYFREVAKIKRQFPHMHYLRNYLIQCARHERVNAMRALGYRVV